MIIPDTLLSSLIIGKSIDHNSMSTLMLQGAYGGDYWSSENIAKVIPLFEDEDARRWCYGLQWVAMGATRSKIKSWWKACADFCSSITLLLFIKRYKCKIIKHNSTGVHSKSIDCFIQMSEIPWFRKTTRYHCAYIPKTKTQNWCINFYLIRKSKNHVRGK